MGAAASTNGGPLQRARKIVTIRAYNARPANETISEQFGKLCRVNTSGDKVLRIQDVKDTIGLSQPWFDELLLRIAGNEVGELLFDSFLEFLHDGSMPVVATVAEPKNPSPRRSKQLGGPRSSFSNGGGGAYVMPPPEPPTLFGFSPLQPSGLASSPLHVFNPNESSDYFKKLDFNRSAEDRDCKPEYDSDSKEEISSSDTSAIARRSVRDNRARENAAMYPDVYYCLGFRSPTTARDIVVHAGSTLSLNRKDCHRKVGPSRPLWRKRETVIHERIVQYTTVDADGTTQELIESERSQNEIVHLECKETGEFAHRESQLFEQLETFNDEVVAHETGNEEYIHMKSKDDEYEHLESNMPTKMAQRTPEEEAAAQAQAEAEGQAAAAFAAYFDPTTGLPLYESPSSVDMVGVPPDPSDAHFSEEARLWWEAQQQYQHTQNPQKFSGASPSQAEFDEDAQKWWEEQQKKNQDTNGFYNGGGMGSPEGEGGGGQQYPQTTTPTPSQQAELDEDAQRWWSDQQKKQKEKNNVFGNAYQDATSPSPLKFPTMNPDGSMPPFSPNQEYDPEVMHLNISSSGTEKENEWPQTSMNQQPEQPVR